MKIKHLILKLTVMLFILAPHTSFTKDKANDHRSQTVVTPDEQFNDISAADQLIITKMQQETFDVIKQHTDTILSCLQQLEQVLAAGKIKFDAISVSKKQLAAETSNIKAAIEQFKMIYTTQQAIDEGSITGIMINKICIDYLLPCLEKNISAMSVNDFDIFMQDNLPIFIEYLQKNNPSLDDLNADNEIQIKNLKIAADNVGLTTFNKAFRYFQDVPMSLTGVPLMTTTQNTALTLAIGALAYGTFAYMIPHDFTIETTKLDPVTNKHKTDKIYFDAQWIPLKRYIGSQDLTGPTVGNVSKETRAEYIKDFGAINHIDRVVRESTNGTLAMAAIGIIATNITPIYKASVKYYRETVDATVSYLRGDIREGKGFNQQQPDVYFKDMINAEQLEAFAFELADFIKHPKRYQNTGTTPPTGILLMGPSQTGKSYYAQAIRTLIDQEFKKEGHQSVKFWNVTQEDVKEYGINMIFEVARYHAPFILFFDEIDMIGAHRDIDKTISSELLTNMSGLLNNSDKKVIVIAASNVPDLLDKALLQNGRLGKQFQFELPSYEHRKEYLIKSLINKNIQTLDMDDVDMIAQETEGQTYNTINTIISTALRFAIVKSRLVTKKDFEDALDHDLRHIRPNTKMSNYEKNIIATYQAGQAAARHILSTQNKVIKITINAIEKQATGSFTLEKKAPAINCHNENYIVKEQPKQIKNGHVFTLSTLNNQDFLSDEDKENEILALLAGQAALEIITGKSFSEFCKEDRAQILYDIEKKISQGSIINDKIRELVIEEKDILTAKIKEILLPHTEFIKTIIDALCKHQTIDKYQWAKLTKNYSQK